MTADLAAFLRARSCRISASRGQRAGPPSTSCGCSPPRTSSTATTRTTEGAGQANCAELPRNRTSCRQTAVMGVSYMVRGRTEAECQQALDVLCRLLGAVQTTRPINPGGRGWVARAVPESTEAPDREVRGAVMR